MKIFDAPKDHLEFKRWGKFRYRICDGLWEAIRLAESNLDLVAPETKAEWPEVKAYATGRKRPKAVQNVQALVRDLLHVVYVTEPSLDFSRRMVRSTIEDAVTLDVPTALTGDERCGFRWDKKDESRPSPGYGDAFRILICTDVANAAGVRPGDGSAVMLAICEILMSIGPVEFWVQQGWHGSQKKNPISVSLFKLNFNGMPAPHQLWFWLESNYKDHPFSSTVNLRDRGGTGTSCNPMMDADIFIGSDFSVFESDGVKEALSHEIDPKMVQYGFSWKKFKQGEPKLYNKVLECYAGMIIQRLSKVIKYDEM